MTSPAKPHGFITKGIHWVSAGMIGYGYFKGLDHVSQLADPALLRYEVGFALALGALFMVRLIWTRYVGGVTRLPAEAPRWEHLASRAVHFGLYAAVFGIVLTGLGIALGVSVPVLGGLFLSAMIGLHDARPGAGDASADLPQSAPRKNPRASPRWSGTTCSPNSCTRRGRSTCNWRRRTTGSRAIRT